MKFTLSIRNKPPEDEKIFYEVGVIKSGVHKHEVGRKQLRGNGLLIFSNTLKMTIHLILGEEREKVAEQVILHSNGSSHDFVNQMVSENFLAGEAVPDYLSAQKLKNCIRNAVSEYMNKEMVLRLSLLDHILLIDFIFLTKGFNLLDYKSPVCITVDKAYVRLV